MQPALMQAACCAAEPSSLKAKAERAHTMGFLPQSSAAAIQQHVSSLQNHRGVSRDPQPRCWGGPDSIGCSKRGKNKTRKRSWFQCCPKKQRLLEVLGDTGRGRLLCELRSPTKLGVLGNTWAILQPRKKEPKHPPALSPAEGRGMQRNTAPLQCCNAHSPSPLP